MQRDQAAREEGFVGRLHIFDRDRPAAGGAAESSVDVAPSPRHFSSVIKKRDLVRRFYR